ARAAPDPPRLASNLPAARASLRVGTRVRRNGDARPDTLPVLAGAGRLDEQPVVLAATIIAQQGGLAIARRDQEVRVPVVVIITDRQTAPESLLPKDGA